MIFTLSIIPLLFVGVDAFFCRSFIAIPTHFHTKFMQLYVTVTGNFGMVSCSKMRSVINLILSDNNEE